MSFQGPASATAQARPAPTCGPRVFAHARPHMGVPDRPRVCTRRPPHTAAQSGRLERGCPGPSATPLHTAECQAQPQQAPQAPRRRWSPLAPCLNPATLEVPPAITRAPCCRHPVDFAAALLCDPHLWGLMRDSSRRGSQYPCHVGPTRATSTEGPRPEGKGASSQFGTTMGSPVPTQNQGEERDVPCLPP